MHFLPRKQSLSFLPSLCQTPPLQSALVRKGGDWEQGLLYLGGVSDRVLDEVPVAWGINDGDVVLAGLKLPQGDVDGDATPSLCLQFVQHPGVFEGALTHLGRGEE